MLNDLTYLGTFDGVVAIASIIHIPEGKLEASYKNINSQEYDREVYGYSKELLEERMNGRFSFVDELEAHDNHWKYYVYKKQSK